MSEVHPAYRIEPPALISFSGGRTSAYMLHQIIRAYDGRLPDDVKVAFANTGREREETLRFVHECGVRWGVRIHWLEYRAGPDTFEEVGFNSAARKGEPFAAIIRKKQYLPNAVTRFCTQDLKIRVMRDFARSLGWEWWLNVIGLRYDEGHRVFKALAANDARKERWRNAMPLAKAKVTKADIMEFWARQPFDLELRSYEGNCDLCFLKGRAKLQTLIREHPGIADWWIEQEQEIGHRFIAECSYADIVNEVRRQGHLFDGFVADDEEHDVECGLLCAAE